MVDLNTFSKIVKSNIKFDGVLQCTPKEFDNVMRDNGYVKYGNQYISNSNHRLNWNFQYF